MEEIDVQIGYFLWFPSTKRKKREALGSGLSDRIRFPELANAALLKSRSECGHRGRMCPHTTRHTLKHTSAHRLKVTMHENGMKKEKMKGGSE